MKYNKLIILNIVEFKTYKGLRHLKDKVNNRY